MKDTKIEKIMIYCVVISVSIFFILPFVLFDTNSIITIHDNLDAAIPYCKMYKDNGLFFKFDAPTNGFSGMSTLYYAMNFSVTPFLYQFLDDFVAYSINYYIFLLFGFFSMHSLLRKLKIDGQLAVLISLCYAILPAVPNLSIAIGILPLIILAFIHFSERNKFSWQVLLLLFYPLFSSFTMTGIFILGFWFLGILILCMRNKRINPNLLIGFLMLCIGYVLVDIRLFYVMFILKTPLNRSIFSLSSTDNISQIKTFVRMLKEYGVNGFYHFASLQRKIIIPIALFTSIFCLFITIKKKHQFRRRSKRENTEVMIKTRSEIKMMFVLEVVVFSLCCIAALYDSGLINWVIKRYIPLLIGFNWGRVWIFNRILWYLIFAFCLQCILKIDLSCLKISRFIKKIQIPSSFFRLCALIIACFQLGYIALSSGDYNDPVKTWFNELVIKTGIAKKLFPDKQFDSFITYNEFYSKSQFDEIKKDISYHNEPVVAFGYHPSVLMYNGFSCIDGYNNAYPLDYMRRFRALIEPELKINQQAMEYYDSWGGRMYLYNAQMDYMPTKNKSVPPMKLNIDMDVFVKDFGGKYILSRVEITNVEELGIEPVNYYKSEKSIYTIYLYRVSCP